MQSLHW